MGGKKSIQSRRIEKLSGLQRGAQAFLQRRVEAVNCHVSQPVLRADVQRKGQIDLVIALVNICARFDRKVDITQLRVQSPKIIQSFAYLKNAEKVALFQEELLPEFALTEHLDILELHRTKPILRPTLNAHGHPIFKTMGLGFD